MKAYQDFRSADEQVKEKLLIVQAIWNRTEVQIEFVKQVASSLETGHCGIHFEVFEKLRSKLLLADAKLDSMIKNRSSLEIKRWKFPFIRDAIDEIIMQLEQWQRIFDPTWYLILCIRDELIDKKLSLSPSPSSPNRPDLQNTELSSSSFLFPAQMFRQSLDIKKKNSPHSRIHVTLSESGLDWESEILLEYSDIRLIPRTTSKLRMFAVDTITCDQLDDLFRVRTDAESLARRLSQLDSGVSGLLPCSGFVKKKDPYSQKLASLHLIFGLQTGRPSPTSLRYHLLNSPRCGLTAILSIARQLASAVSYIHTCGWVHKNIRPESILILPDEKSTCPSILGSAYLMGFDSFRNVNFHTMRVGDGEWDRDLYRHPSRQGILAQETYIMQHDVYSLGVCLLELGLWESFIYYKEKMQDEGDINKAISPSLGLKLRDFRFQRKESISSSSESKKRLVDIAMERLPVQMGDKYTSIVITCLTCLDQENEDFGESAEMEDEDGILVGVRFIEKVLLKINEIVL